ncbi:response regulator [Pedobacter insulae]|uniref:Two-component system, cell cycle response regulator DivK n=1 Tax=Pedobacter insulae TaxID=414048 RepID=A0A1I2XI62_9SPHI|nr:response regulator [Pedobacter insulae]SFH13092.1 two-component system, cell cycle response regulator DivK [Pedobacter insulae]
MNKKVFIFDDNTDILELCTLILEDAGYEIKTSATSNDITNQVSAYMPDLIFMDNWLPDVGGVEATQELKSDPLLKHIPVIYFSANNDVKALAEKAGADNYLAKPFDIQAFEEIVKSSLIQDA